MSKKVTLHTFTDTGHNNERKLSTTGDVLISRTVDPLEFAIRNERQEILHNLLKTLPENERNAIKLKFFPKEHTSTSYRSIANKLNYSHEQTRKLVYNGLVKLRISLSRYFDQSERSDSPPFTGTIPHSDIIKKASRSRSNTYPELLGLTGKERAKKCSSLYYLNNKERLKKKTRDFYEENKSYWYVWCKNWREKNRKRLNEYNNEYHRMYAKELRNGYVKSVIANGSRLSSKDIPQELVELKRQQLKLIRLTKEKGIVL